MGQTSRTFRSISFRKANAKTQSHDIAKRVRPAIQQIAAKYQARVKVSEVPPGPPVLQTLVAEVYGPDYQRQIEVARQIRDIFDKTAGVVDVDSYIEDEQDEISVCRWTKRKQRSMVFLPSRWRPRLRIAVGGLNRWTGHQATGERGCADRLCDLPRAERSSVDDLKQIKVVGQSGNLVPLGELVRVEEQSSEQSIYHKNLMPVVYVTGDVAGEEESPVYAILQAEQGNGST